ncbi:endonuclease/exonuclease/phosphatase family protein [Aestuariivita sp.]|jgi:endonuclease/exonuclease/phosphatase family metal-dependent hydrolase|uniref:endonuclease/exonuclease/phosphatase family protein n=1 Tax=Aestuariivita sp. TaxID=1872407 RepID=UPI002172D439|nr:endonuclease/exonuclease/phosphatase family protein [Aestuariivita sp.]MCE8009295.1 endonuclease [Aestuariivita sp.]
MTQLPSRAIRVASYNIQKCIGTDLRRKPTRILRVLRALGAQIVTLQEADKRLPPRPAALPAFALRDEGWQIVPLGGAGSLGWHGNAILYRGGPELMRADRLILPGLEPRGAVLAEFETPLGRLRVIGLHLGLVAQWRRRQLHALMRLSAPRDPVPTIWAGDFNDWDRGPLLDRAAPAMHFLPPDPSFPAPAPVAPLDRIAVSSGLHVSAHGVHTARPARIASDHLPIWADLTRA